MPRDPRDPLPGFVEPAMTWRGLAAALALLAVLLAAMAWWELVASTLAFVVVNLLSMLPVLLLAAGLAAGLRASGADGALAGAVRQRQGGMVLLAAAAGAVTPVCGLGTLPVIAALLRSGVPLGPVMAFWLSSPVTDPAMFAITAALLGAEFAIAKAVLALFIGIAGGAVAVALDRAGRLQSPLRGQALAVADSACAPLPPRLAFWAEPRRVSLFLGEARANLQLIAGWLAVALVAESIIRAYLPAETVARFVGSDSAFAVPLAVLVGAPIYLDGYAALPLVRGLMDLGMGPGAAMGLLLSGGIVSLYASLAVFALVRLPVFLLYLGLALALSLLAALLFDAAAG